MPCFGGPSTRSYSCYRAGPQRKGCHQGWPFTESKECLAGFYLIEAADLNEATQIASQMPPARVGSIEVRPVRELTSTSGEPRHL